MLINLTVLRSMDTGILQSREFRAFRARVEGLRTFHVAPLGAMRTLVVHRALIRAHGWGDDGLTDAETERLGVTLPSESPMLNGVPCRPNATLLTATLRRTWLTG